MKFIAYLMAAAVATTAITPASAGGFDQGRIRKLIKAFQDYHPRVPSETVQCSAADGSTVAFTTTTTGDKHLTSPVIVVSGSQRALVSPEWVSVYENEDAGIAMKAYKGNSTDPLFTFKTELVPTTAPKTDEVGTYAGTMTVFGTKKAVTCSAFQKGAGTLAAQVLSPINNMLIVCQKTDSSGALGDTLADFEIYRTESHRLISDIRESRSQSDSEVLGNYTIAQYSLKKMKLTVETDDGGITGASDMTLDVIGKRVPPAQTGIWGFWTGTYKRAAPLREYEAKVTCGAYTQ